MPPGQLLRSHGWEIVLRPWALPLSLALCLGGPSFGLAQSADPRVGSWRLVRMSVDSRTQPAGTSNWIYSQEGSDLRVDIHSLSPTGRALHWSFQTKRDGTEVRVRGNPAVDRVVVTRRNEWIDEIVYKKAGVATAIGTSEISVDGQTMTLTLKNASGGVAVGVYKKSQ